ncbi:cytochrome c [Herbaspirillum lusitanum]|uniref:Cytochrome c n=1 Tax=Herbaspirillum lusitanum TaxID=213312 RepID=A0ABW9AB42_9BURK
MKHLLLRALMLVLLIAIVLPAAVIALQFYGAEDMGRAEPATNSDRSQQIVRGAYLARAGDCMACHTVRGGPAYAGGRAIPTSFGTIYSPNITPDRITGIGSWTADDFWRALHHGRSRDGSFLYPAFPFTNYTKVTRSDADALFAYLQDLPAVAQQNQEHALRFPYNQRLLLAGWRALYFRPESFKPDSAQSAAWNRGAYLVQGLGHCSACHTARNAVGATVDKADLAGGLIPALNWYAPSLRSNREAGLGDWEVPHIVDLLKTGVSPRATAFGPMAEVVGQSLQHLTTEDLTAMALYLKSLTQADAPAEDVGRQPPLQEAQRIMALGETLYQDHCASCHRGSGKGFPPNYPPLDGNRAMTTTSAVNAIRMVLNGGFPPSTAGNPHPYGMPPFGQTLNDQEVAAIVSYIRNSWSNRAGMVSANDVNRNRAVPAQ